MTQAHINAYADCYQAACLRWGIDISAQRVGIIAGERGADFPNPFPTWHRMRDEFDTGREQGRKNAARRAPRQGTLL